MSTPIPLPAADVEPIGACRVLRDVAARPGVETPEGRLVPLLSGTGIRSHLIVMHPGQWCAAHPHPTESLIYTISGRWVFCTTEEEQEVRTVITAGDLFHFPADVPTGFETPFDEAAVILILKEGGAAEDDMVGSMLSARDAMDAEAADGQPFTLAALPDDHPAWTFAATVTGAGPS